MCILPDIKEPMVRDPQGGNHGQGEEREVHERIIDAAHTIGDRMKIF